MAKAKSQAKARRAAAKTAEKTLIDQAAKGKTADITYVKKKGKVILRNVGAVGIRGDKIYVQDQTKPDAKVKSLIRANVLNADPSEDGFNDQGFNEFKDKGKEKK